MDKYFATLPTDEIGTELCDRVNTYVRHLTKQNIDTLWRRSFRYYNNSIRTGGQLNRNGTQGELTTINVNHFRNIVQHLLVNVTASRPAFDARSVNNDYKSQTQTVLAQGLLDYYMREKRLERVLKKAAENALIFGEGFVEVNWNVQGGEIYGVHPETSAPIHEGELEYNVFTPYDVIRDPYNHNPDVIWVILRTWVNRFDMIAKYPDLEDKITNLSSDNKEMGVEYDLRTDVTMDTIPCYTFYHKPTPSVPKGRFVQFLSDDCICLEGPLPYRDIPVYRISPSDIDDSIFGHSPAYDLLPIQEALDGLYSTIITNQNAFGVQNITVPRNSNLNTTQFAGGLTVLEYDAQFGKPEPMELLQTAPEIFRFTEQLERLAETISGVNSVARGNPESSLKSGAALALVQSMSLQYSQGLQNSFVQLLEDVGTATINTLRDYARVPRVAMIVGKHNRSYMKEFTGDDLSQINRVVVDSGNPLTKTIAGKVNLAEQLLQNKLINTAEEYVQVLNTGRLDPMIEGQTSELLLIRSENEKLTEGRDVVAMITDDHRLHILEHRTVAASPEARDNPELVQALNAHLQEHINMLKNADPVLLQLFNQPNVNQSSQGAVPQAMNNQQPLELEAGKVNMPNMPTNPLTNEKWNPENGGLPQ